MTFVLTDDSDSSTNDEFRILHSLVWIRLPALTDMINQAVINFPNGWKVVIRRITPLTTRIHYKIVATTKNQGFTQTLDDDEALVVEQLLQEIEGYKP